LEWWAERRATEFDGGILGESEKGDEMTREEQNKRRYEYNRKPEPRTAQEKTIDLTAAEVLANARQIVERAKMRGWIKEGVK
jgi:hypothetical protein